MQAGFTFELAEKHHDIDDHLWIILSDPVQDIQNILLVSLTTHKPHKDQACVVERQEHPWLTHRSCVAYEFARTASLENLVRLRDSGTIQMREPVSPGLLTRIRARVAESRLKMKYADLLIAQGLLNLDA